MCAGIVWIAHHLPVAALLLVVFSIVFFQRLAATLQATAGALKPWHAAADDFWGVLWFEVEG